jgi:D-glycero-D-manno-heptose 1,7-bisphosphate phosphatase
MTSNSRLALDGRSTSGRKAVFLDRDGVIVEDVHYLNDLNKVRVLPGAARAVRDLAAEYYVIVVTNQSGVARGAFTEKTVLEVHRRMVQVLWDESGQIDALIYCPHLPHGDVAVYSIECPCRKPLPGMLNRAADKWGLDVAGSHMVGDTFRDIRAGQAAGVRTILITGQYAAEPTDPKELNTESASDLTEAANLILADGPVSGQPQR